MGVERTRPSTTAIILVDVQEKLIPTLPPEALADLVRASRILLTAARELFAPVFVTEQYSRGLGPTIQPLRDLVHALGVTPIEKLTFSACAEPAFIDALKATHVEAAVVIGIETHICVFQTVRDLVGRGLRVDVPLDGVASRRDDHKRAGLELCQRAGAGVTTAETILFDWMVQCGTDTFRTLSKLIR
ncbi:MAG: isochorismatase family protein [Myxococcales bacterium]|nr:isochorismatase family protein [Myxococcales bacterium]